MTTTYTEEEVLVSIENVSKEYHGKLVLKNVNAVIKDIKVTGEVKGQVVGFIGPSGIGKTTLFRIIAGLEQPTSGRVVLDDTNRPVRAGEVGVVAQNYPLFAHRTVFSNLMVAARKRLPEKEAREKVVGYLSDFDLADRTHAYPAELSGGQRQRCAILQQVLCSETFLLMDEPFSGLDPIAKAKAQALITRVANLNDKNTIIIVSHDIASTTMVSDHLWCLGRERDAAGKIVPGASIVQTYNLIDRDLAWHPEIDKQPEFTMFMHEVSDRFGQL
jgi:ABC-type nitrate/sulfonate/bicarbonate transport system ATPase subunit